MILKLPEDWLNILNIHIWNVGTNISSGLEWNGHSLGEKVCEKLKLISKEGNDTRVENGS